MIKVRHQIELMEGVKVNLLFTLSMFEVARKRDLSIVIEDTDNQQQIIEFYNKVIYIAAINDWTVRAYDKPEMGEFPYTYMDFAIWAQSNQREFGKMITAAALAIAGEEKPDTSKDVKKK